MFDSLTSMISSQMYVGQSIQLKTASIEVNLLKSNISKMDRVQTVQDCKIQIEASFCDLINSINKMDCSNSILTQKVKYIILPLNHKFKSMPKLKYINS